MGAPGGHGRLRRWRAASPHCQITTCAHVQEKVDEVQVKLVGGETVHVDGELNPPGGGVPEIMACRTKDELRVVDDGEAQHY
eukprot:CAMPEP_0176332004 /NCGR_PEP_ID=MMETSP0121_2-20121125/76853_1 /TAXON_ID=160619 /ORGANISM="Kryptoperidinium foliaceum, Strain CCMP 1326" /LENGTH=81 /DNA_ID=CAMNT_0017674889 /DNA_START=12 /DNA_END=257 /DNA_ORIENTATION=+